MLEVQNLCKSFGSLAVLQGVDLQVETGDVISILGPSGSGKTTLLRCLNFLERADEGLLRFDGAEYAMHKAGKKEIAAIRQKTAFVFQNYNLFRNKTVLQNITEGLTTVRKIPHEQAVETAMALLKKMNLENRASAYPAQLSGGQQQRVGICRALALNPKVILFDEPTSALDPELVGEVLGAMRAVAKTGITMIVVTHEISFARDVADRVIYMEGGVLVEQGHPKEVIENPEDERTLRFLRSLLNEPMDYSI